jgi:hypothetical protein
MRIHEIRFLDKSEYERVVKAGAGIRKQVKNVAEARPLI